METGIPAPGGGTFVPKMVRVGRHQLNYGKVEHILSRVLGLKYDNDIFDPGEQGNHPSDKALRSMATETLFLATTSTAASRALPEMKVKFCVYSIDEAAHPIRINEMHMTYERWTANGY